MTGDELLVQNTTDLLFDTVSKALALVDVTDRLPTSAILIYETIGPDGQQQFDYVVSNTVTLTSMIGAGHALQTQATRDLLDDDE
jgi:hypothetical protein